MVRVLRTMAGCGHVLRGVCRSRSGMALPATRQHAMAGGQRAKLHATSTVAAVSDSSGQGFPPTSPSRCVAGLLGIARDGNSSFLRGSAAAPPLLRAAVRSDSANGYCERGFDVLGGDAGAGGGTHDDFGDLAEDCSHDDIRDKVGEILDAGLCPLVLGGDHSISFPVVKAFADWREANLAPEAQSFTILHFDAHTDLYDELDGNRLSHACPFARLMEENERRTAARLPLRMGLSQVRENGAIAP